MRFNIALPKKPKWGATSAGITSAAFVAALLFAAHVVSASPGVTLVVDEDGMATAGNCNSTTATPYSTISSAVTAAAAGDTVKVCPGAYAENVFIDKAITLKGAKAGTSVNARTFGNANESTVTGLVTIQSPDVKIDGFSFTNPGQGLAVLVKAVSNDASIKKNIIQTVGSNTFVGPTVGVYLELGPDNTNVVGNKISDVQSQTGSAQGILVGDSTSANPSLGVVLNNNTITDITSVNRGAYGINVNNGANSAVTSTGYTEGNISGNVINHLSGGWAHAIGLEGETPNIVLEYNTISDLTDTNPAPFTDAIGIYFEDNVFFFTSKVDHNSLDVGATNYGIAVNPTLSAHYGSLSVDGECNWWGASSGAGAIGTGTGSLVSAGVDFKPALKSSNLNKDCGDNHWGESHHDGWNKFDWENDWRND